MMMKKILITGITGFRNHGVQALVYGIVAGLMEQYEGAEIDLLTQDPQYDSVVVEGLHINFVQDPWRVKSHGLKLDVKHRLAKYFKGLDGRGDFIQDYDLIVVSGGDMFGPDYGSIEADLEPLRAAQKYGVKYVFLGQSVGRFKDEQQSKAFTDVARGAEIITVRETLSESYLCDALGLSRDNVKLAPDPAFLLKVTEDVERLRDLVFGDHEEPFVSISVSEGIQRFSGTDVDQHLNAIVNLINYFTSEIGVRVLIVPHVHETYLWNDDSWLAQRVGLACKDPTMVKIAPIHLSASDYKALIAASEFCIAERMHAAIAALSTAVPVFCIGYSIKYRGILGDIFGRKVADDNLLISIKDFVQSSGVPEACLQTWQSRAVYKQVLETKIGSLKQAANLNYNLLPRD
jgi:colanic acid/amylovoran biosynthesis protein